jgi:hypothetical protein
MSDKNKTEAVEEAPFETAHEPVVVEAPEVAAPENAQVGDDEITPAAPAADKVTVVDEPVPAQTTGAPAKVVEQQPVHEVYVDLDRVITDPNSPEAVQIPDAGRGDASLPAHVLANPSPEEVFASEA